MLASGAAHNRGLIVFSHAGGVPGEPNITGGMSATQAGHNQPVYVALCLGTQGPLRADLTD